MFALLYPPAMATAPTSIPALIIAHGIRNTIKELPMSPTTLTNRMNNPETFTVSELSKLATLIGADFITLVKLAKQQMDNPIEVPVSERGRSANKS